MGYTGDTLDACPSETMPPLMTRALFLDRDGVINVDHAYVSSAESFAFMDGIFELCQAAQTAGLALVVITNQSGIGRGYYTEEDFQRLTTWMLAEFATRGITIAKVYFSPHHPDAAEPRYRTGAFDRKPEPGMLLRARRELDLDLAGSLLLGDKLSDIDAGRRAGVGTLCLLDTAGAYDAAAQPEVRVFPTLHAARTALFPA